MNKAFVMLLLSFFLPVCVYPQLETDFGCIYI
jgi:hypothetical protein